MTKKAYNKAKLKADELVSKIDKFIQSVKEEGEYTFAGLIMKRLIKASNKDDLNDIAFELEIEANIKTFKIDSLAEEMKFEAFLEDIKANPYQLTLVA